MPCCQTTSAAFKLAALILVIGLVFNAIGFGAPFWSNRAGDFEGLWQICIGGVCSTTVGNSLSNSNWFLANQALQTIGLGLALLGLMVALLFFCASCMNHCFNACGVIITIQVFVAGIALVAGLTLYGVYAVLGNANINFLFSYWLVLTAAVLYFVSGIFFSLGVDRNWRNDAVDD